MEASDGKPTGGDKAPAAASSPPGASQPQDDVERYTVEGWSERVRRFGQTVSPHAIAGALHDVAEDEMLTEDDVRGRLDQFTRREGV